MKKDDIFVYLMWQCVGLWEFGRKSNPPKKWKKDVRGNRRHLLYDSFEEGNIWLAWNGMWGKRERKPHKHMKHLLWYYRFVLYDGISEWHLSLVWNLCARSGLKEAPKSILTASFQEITEFCYLTGLIMSARWALHESPQKSQEEIQSICK